MQFRRVLGDIKNLKIQGAENVAKKAVSALKYSIHHSKAHNAKQLLHEISDAAKQLRTARSTEPCLRNALKYVLTNISKSDLIQLIKDIDRNTKEVNEYFRSAEKKIAEYGSRKIKRKHIVFTHCHSSTVMMILAKAAFSGTKFELHNCETRPKLQGRITAKEVSAMGIPVKHYVDSAARMALKKADLFLFGADAIQSDGRIINKIGTEMLLEIAHKYDIPSYCCTVSWKFDPKTIYGVDEPIENRNAEEVWPKAPKKVTIMNPAFEIIDPYLVTGVISELGVFRSEVFIDELAREQPWMFNAR